MSTDWRPAICVQGRPETLSSRSIRLKVDNLGPVVAGQHIDIRLTADDGYQAVRSYSLSATPRGGPGGTPLGNSEVEIAVEELPEGEVSPYLVEALAPGDPLEVRGPVGGWFVWHPTDSEPVQLIGGGSGVAPLVAILRARIASTSAVPMRLLYSVRAPDTVYFADELASYTTSPNITVDLAYTRVAPHGEARPPGRLTDRDIENFVQEPGSGIVYVCGPNSFVAAVTDLLLARGYDSAAIRTERFGGA
ncbi:FAD-binding oxidoreductase [Frondihabitans australicus]|uniref:FAD-binding oxidoreductase n=1 Tax=Frondihabitans australicus TaxID=386892 RepID=UPI001FE8B9C4|nr:FAD-binding oxidoreductase [Frondihabitans australicus]